MRLKLNVPKQYFQDKLILLMLGVNLFLGFLSVLLIVLRLINKSGNVLIVQYRPGAQIGAFQSGKIRDILYFALFAVLVVVFHVVLSIRVYNIKRELAIVAMSFSIILLVLATIVSNALLTLH
ncbi:MAG: hypothetical protein ACREGA_01705 [Candidatus Saccharimonadales bacterium]